MRIFKNAWFQRFARKERLTDEVLIDAVRQAEKGLIDADLGGGVIKQRVARKGRGKSGGYRTIILFRRGERAFLCTDLPKATVTILRPMSWPTLKSWPRCIWRYLMNKSTP